MRYNPDTDRAISIDAIAEQCRRAIMKANEPTVEYGVEYDDIIYLYRWENDMMVAA